jgi:hypothetical protein
MPAYDNNTRNTNLGENTHNTFYFKITLEIKELNIFLQLGFSSNMKWTAGSLVVQTILY